MGGAEAAVSMGILILFLILLYFGGIGFSALIDYVRKKWKGSEKQGIMIKSVETAEIFQDDGAKEV